jgi:hypothetical protein
MATAPKREGRFGRFLLLVALVAAAMLLLRMLGPGSNPAESPVAPAPSPAPGAPSPGATDARDAGAAAGRPSPSSGSLKGAVLGPDGAPAAGATVQAFLDPDGDGEPRTLHAGPADDQGRFDAGSFDGPSGRLRVRASRGPLSVEVEVHAEPGPLRLELRLPDSFTVGGMAISAEEGRPLPGLDVAFGDRTAKTDALGRFSFAGVPASALAAPLPELRVSGAGRRAHARALPVDRALDDLLVRLERE